MILLLLQVHILVLVTGMLVNMVEVEGQLEADVIVIGMLIVHIIKAGVDLHQLIL